MRRRNSARLLVPLVAGLLLVSACSGDDDDAAAAPTAPPASSTAPAATVPATTAPASTVPATTAPATIAPPASTAPPTTAPAGRDFSAIDPIVSRFVTDNELTGAGVVVVDRDEGIVHQGYWGEFSADRVSLIASSSKMITAGVLMRLHDDGVIDIDARVVDTVDWAMSNPEITIAQLVSNSSGLPGLTSDDAGTAHVCQFFADTEIEQCAAEAFETPNDDDAVIPPDTEFRYGGVQWQVAGAVAETVTGMTWDELIQEIYIEPCGVDSLGYNNHWLEAGGFEYPVGFDPADLAPTDNPHMEGGAYITAPDYAQLLLMHLRGGECPNGQVMSAEAVARTHEDRVLAEYGDAGPDNPGYGMGWWVNRETGQISDGGAYGSVPWLDLEDGYGVYLVVEADSGIGNRLAQLLNPVVETAMTADV